VQFRFQGRSRKGLRGRRRRGKGKEGRKQEGGDGEGVGDSRGGTRKGRRGPENKDKREEAEGEQGGGVCSGRALDTLLHPIVSNLSTFLEFLDQISMMTYHFVVVR
jgi:hypothetical protein